MIYQIVIINLFKPLNVVKVPYQMGYGKGIFQFYEWYQCHSPFFLNIAKPHLFCYFSYPVFEPHGQL
jgi:hypothetical protein